MHVKGLQKVGPRGYLTPSQNPVAVWGLEDSDGECKVRSRVGLECAHFLLFILLWYLSLNDPPFVHCQ
jgi:hypothetical protein